MRDLPSPRPVRPPERISPSQATTSGRCGRRFVLDKCTPEAEQDLPSPSPFRYLGSVFHGLLEAARRGKAGDPPSENTLRAIWRDLVTRQEEHASRNGDDDWLPLASIRTIERTRLSAVRLALRQPVRSGAGKGIGWTEVRLESPDGMVVGKVDAIDRSDGSIRLTDFKSGDVVDGRGTVKDDYSLQLRLYAALFHEVEGSWPDELRVVDRRGGAHDVQLDREQALRELQSLRERLQTLRGAVGDAESSDQEHLAAIAEPSPEGCALCRHRPSCTAYMTRLVASGLLRLGSGDFDSVDLHGNLVGATQIAGDRTRIQLRTESGNYVVRGLTPDGRFRPSDADTAPPPPGSSVAVFAARPSRPLKQMTEAILFDAGAGTRAFVVERCAE
jgi:hypothetical protein